MASRAPAGRPAGRFAQFKLVLLGESAVGKSSLVLRFVKDQFDDYRESTIGAAFLTQTISLDENTTVKFEIWDTAGQERYKSLAPMYYRNANCAVVVYDITQASSLDKAKSWIKELQRQANENIVIALAGNKVDMVNENPERRAIQTADAEGYAREAGLLFFETSAKSATNVRELFTAIAKKLPLDQAGPRNLRSNPRQGVDLGPREGPDASNRDPSTKNSILSSDPAFLPGSQSRDAPNKVDSAAATPVTPSSTSSIPPENVPKPPPSPPTKTQTAPPTATNPASSQSPSTPPPPPPGPPPPQPRRRRRGLRFLLYSVVTGGLLFAGGVAFALRNDNFHDFFTEYVPFGEEAVLYFQEQEFRRRFPHASAGAVKIASGRKDESGKVTIPSKSGLSWRVADGGEETGSDVSQKGRHMSALSANEPSKESAKNAQQSPSTESSKNKSQAVSQAKSEAEQKGKKSSSSKETKPLTEEQPKSKPASSSKPPEPAATASTTPEPASRTPAIPPVTQISPLSIEHADEPIVQELVKTLNDIITVVNSDSADASNKYSPALTKAKESLSGVGSKILALKEAAKKSAEEEIANAHRQFDEGAKELVRRIDAAREEDAVQFRQEFEAEKEKLSQSYEEKIKNELDRHDQLTEQQRKNELAEQALQLQQKFIADIQGLVEEERNGRLSKLAELSDNVGELQKLTSDWNGVIDTNLATQKLQVAVDAVRNALEKTMTADDRPKPFVRELAALKEVASGDPIVDAAIASINPTSYQRGLPSSAALIDRFRRVASEVRKASLLPENAGFASHIASAALSKIMFKKQGMADGSDVESILTRTETLLEEGDLDGAAREMNSLQGWAKVLSKDWLGDVRKALEVKQALEVRLHTHIIQFSFAVRLMKINRSSRQKHACSA
ncbi:MAG: hypothetical protein Q9227_000701 [Pyrenula ochraceoflavens]